MKITEKQLRYIIRESLNEISWQAATQAAGKAQNSIGDKDYVDKCLESLNSAIDEIGLILTDYSNHKALYRNGEFILPDKVYYNSQAEQLLDELSVAYSKVENFLKRKYNQAVNLSDIANNKFKDAHNGIEYDKYAETNDGSDEEFWDNYDNSNFSSRKY